jgi:ankyrin repeat protein
MNPLLEAILTDSSEEVQRLVTKFPISDQENLLGQSALHLAVSHPQHLEILLKSGADVNVRDKYGVTPLMYAGAIGNAQVAIRLLDCGADPYPNALRHRNFLQLAATRGHLTTVKDILSHIHNSSAASKYSSRDLLALGLIVLADMNDINWKRYSQFFQTLLEWGADPNISYVNCHGRACGTLLHKIRDIAVVKSIISHGFTRFNHLDGTGAHALISSSAEPDPGLMELLLSGGSLVNHENCKGHTTLHMVVQHLKNYIEGSGSNQNEDYDTRIHVLDCIKLLLERQADPCLGDKCRCACSRLGCTPSNLIIKEHIMSSSSRKDIWAMEFFSLVEETRGIETAKQCLLDMLRLVKFEELELTHTCQQETFLVQSLNGDNFIDEEDVEEILDEEKEIIETLEQEMLRIEKLAWDDLEQLLLRAVVLRKWDEELELELQSRFTPQVTGVSISKFYNHRGQRIANKHSLAHRQSSFQG